MSTTELPKQYNPLESEAKWQKYWEESGVFVAENQSDKDFKLLAEQKSGDPLQYKTFTV